MIVNQFMIWARTATPSQRADGASALARAYLYSELTLDQKAEALRALTVLLDDSSPLVRRALAEAFAGAIDAPHHIVLALADDQSSIASIVLARSPILSEAELIDCAATADPAAQAAIASRPELPSPVAAAIAEVGAPEALVALAANETIRLPDFSLRRMVERDGENADLREAMLRRSDLLPCVRVDLVAATARALTAFVAGRNWMSDERLARVAREAKDRAAIVIADADRDHGAAPALISHLRQSGQLTVGFIFRAILSGKLDLFQAALSDLAGMSSNRVAGLIDDCDGAGFSALYRRAGLPADLLSAFRIALRAIRETDWAANHGPSLSRTVVERVLTGCEAVNNGELDKLIVLLRRFETEAARDEARIEHRPPSGPAVPLALGRPAAPLLLTELDAPGHSLPPLHGKERAPERLRLRPVVVDMDAIAAELLAA